MALFNTKKEKGVPAVSTASLPDIIFMLLFFFMIVTKPKESSMKVMVHVPKVTELTKLEKKSLVASMYIGKPTASNASSAGQTSRLQIEGKFADLVDIPIFISRHKANLPESDKKRAYCSLKVDKETTMGLVEDVKITIRKAYGGVPSKLNYSAAKREEY